MLGKSETRVVFIPPPRVCCLLWFGFNPLRGREQQERVWKAPALVSVRCQMHTYI